MYTYGDDDDDGDDGGGGQFAEGGFLGEGGGGEQYTIGGGDGDGGGGDGYTIGGGGELYIIGGGEYIGVSPHGVHFSTSFLDSIALIGRVTHTSSKIKLRILSGILL